MFLFFKYNKNTRYKKQENSRQLVLQLALREFPFCLSFIDVKSGLHEQGKEEKYESIEVSFHQ